MCVILNYEIYDVCYTEVANYFEKICHEKIDSEIEAGGIRGIEGRGGLF